MPEFSSFLRLKLTLFTLPMDSHLWHEAVSAVLVTLETALLAEDGSSPLNSGKSASATITASHRKHTWRGSSSETISDIVLPSGSSKRRRESTDIRDATIRKPSAKCRRLSNALASQLARSLSVDNNENDSNGFTRGISPILSASSSTSSSSTSMSWQPAHSNNYSTGQAPTYNEEDTEMVVESISEDGNISERILVKPISSRSLKAREKLRADASLCGSSGVDMDNNDNSFSSWPSHKHLSTLNYQPYPDEDVFTLLLQTPLVSTYACGNTTPISDESLRDVMQDWAIEKASQGGPRMSPVAIMDELECQLARLKQMLPAILDHLSKRDLYGVGKSEQLRELCGAIVEVANIGDWLYQRKFQMLPAVFPELAITGGIASPALPMLRGAIRMARVSVDMHALLRSQPSIGEGKPLATLANEYEELVIARRTLYGDIITQNGLPWKAIGLPVDNVLLMRVRQWLAATTEHCLDKVAHMCERWAKSSALPNNKDGMSISSLLQNSIQVLHSAAMCAVLCGDTFPGLAPQVLYIVASCTQWTCNKSKSGSDDSRSKIVCRGKQLESRCLRLIQCGESILKLLSFSKGVLVGSERSSIFDIDISDEHSSLESLASSVVDFSWSLATIFAAFREDGQVTQEQIRQRSGTLPLLIDFIIKYSQRIAEFGGKSQVAPQCLLRLRRIGRFRSQG